MITRSRFLQALAGGAGALALVGCGDQKAADAGDEGKKDAAARAAEEERREFIRAENEDDDGYDPYSDRRPVSEPLFERDPWA